MFATVCLICICKQLFAGKYVGNRPIKLRKSQWRDRQIDNVKKKEREKKRLGFRWLVARRTKDCDNCSYQCFILVGTDVYKMWINVTNQFSFVLLYDTKKSNTLVAVSFLLQFWLDKVALLSTWQIGNDPSSLHYKMVSASCTEKCVQVVCTPDRRNFYQKHRIWPWRFRWRRLHSSCNYAVDNEYRGVYLMFTMLLQ